MAEDNDIRWLQRFRNFERAFHLLEESMSVEQPTVLERAGMIHFFEMSFELSWKLLKDYLVGEGFTDVNTPRAAIKKAFETGLVTDGHGWLLLLEDRNMTSHTYDEQMAAEIEKMIRNKYFYLLKQLELTFSKMPQ